MNNPYLFTANYLFFFFNTFDLKNFVLYFSFFISKWSWFEFAFRKFRTVCFHVNFPFQLILKSSLCLTPFIHENEHFLILFFIGQLLVSVFFPYFFHFHLSHITGWLIVLIVAFNFKMLLVQISFKRFFPVIIKLEGFYCWSQCVTSYFFFFLFSLLFFWNCLFTFFYFLLFRLLLLLG